MYQIDDTDLVPFPAPPIPFPFLSLLPFLSFSLCLSYPTRIYSHRQSINYQAPKENPSCLPSPDDATAAKLNGPSSCPRSLRLMSSGRGASVTDPQVHWKLTTLPSHCDACKLLSGGETTLNQIVPKDALKITKGTLKTYTYSGDSGTSFPFTPFSPRLFPPVLSQQPLFSPLPIGNRQPRTHVLYAD